MTPQDLKLSLFQMAFQGKLVPQHKEEGVALDLLQEIDRLKDAKQLIKEKAYAEINEDELPFEIPESWMWVHLNQIAVTSLGKTLDKAKNTGTLRPYLCSINVYWNGIDLAKVKEAKFEDTELEKYLLRKGDLLICEGGEVGRSAIWCSDEEMYYQNALHRVRFYHGIIPEFYKYLLECYKGMGIIDRYSKGVTIKHLVQNALYSMWMPLPPLAEQKRIVAKIEELLPYIDRYEKAWSRLEDFNKRFPVDMQKSILQMAMQGKLVEQRPEEGTGEELYQQIQAEKQKLIKEGKIKKEKPLPEITEDEIPFEIPDSWKWVRFSELMNSMSTGPFGSMLHKSDYVQEGIPLVNPANIINGEIVASNKMMVSAETAKRLESYTLRTGMIIMGRRGEMGRCAVVGDRENGWLCGTGSFFMMPTSCVFLRYISTLFLAPYAKGYLSGASVGTTMNNLNHKILSCMPVPLPSLAEQKRIVAKLEEILPLCERLK